MFDGLLLSLLSMVRRTKEDIHVHFLTMDFTHKKPKFKPFRRSQANFIETELRKYNPNFKISIIDCTAEYNQLLKDNANEKPVYSPYCTLRLLADRYEQLQGKIIYLDIDTMVYGNIKDLIELRQFIKSSWYMELGIQSNYNMKRESLNSSETTMDESVLLPLIDDMLECRKLGVEQINKMFGTNITVELDSSWKEVEYDYVETENTIDPNKSDVLLIMVPPKIFCVL